MAITKTGNILTAAMQGLKALPGLASTGLKNAATPMGLGFAALDYTTGDSNVGGAVGGALAGSLAGDMGSGLAKRFAPRLGGVGRMVGGMALGLAGYTAGRSAGSQLTPSTWRRGVPPIKNNLGLPPGAEPPSPISSMQ